MKTIKNTFNTLKALTLFLLFSMLGNSRVISKVPEDLIVIILDTQKN
ncbi:hypothetical protein [Aquimarina algicola]|nr:hypothetical protein [Aquimarina algicola]